jgi:hypothetical protein
MNGFSWNLTLGIFRKFINTSLFWFRAMRVALPKGSKGLEFLTSCPPKDRNRTHFQNFVVCVQKIRKLDKVQSNVHKYYVQFLIALIWFNSWDSTVDIGVRLWAGRPRSRSSNPVGARNFSLLHNVQIGSEAHTASYTMGNGGLFLRR